MFFRTEDTAQLWLIVVSPVDLFLLAIGLRLILGQFAATRNGRLCQTLKEFIDPMVYRLGRRLKRWRGKPAPTWMPWVIIIGAGLAARHLLGSFIASISQTQT